MISNLKLLSILALLSFFLFPIFPLKVGASSEDTATLAITQAEETMVSAYDAILEAEQVKANVSELLELLDVAGEHLAEAHMLYRLGDFDGAVDSADLSSAIGADVKNDAEELKIDAHQSWITSLLTRITISIAGVMAVVFGTFIAWRAFRRRYFRQA